MVTVVVVINLALALMLLYVAWRVRRIAQRLARLADTLTALEISTHAVLYKTPEAISRGQQGIHKLRYGNQSLALKLQRVRQASTLLGLGQQVWRQFYSRTQFLKNALAKYR
jgi:DNA polymerase III psi subunit